VRGGGSEEVPWIYGFLRQRPIGRSESEQRQTDPTERKQAASGGSDRSEGCNGFRDRHVRTFCMTVTLCQMIGAQKWREGAARKLRAVVAVLQHHPGIARKNP
jgi:hypothetical protein